MSKSRWVILILIVIAVASYLVHQQYKLPDGVTPMGDEEDIVWLAYGTSAIAAITAIIGLIREVVGLIRDIRKGDV